MLNMDEGSPQIIFLGEAVARRSSPGTVVSGRVRKRFILFFLKNSFDFRSSRRAPFPSYESENIQLMF